MMTETLKFAVAPSDPSVPLKLSVWLNDQCCLPTTVVNETLNFSTEISDEKDKEYTLKIIMDGKTKEHTKIDEQGNILQDALLNFVGFNLMGINIDQVIAQTGVYRHNHNGSTEYIDDKFLLCMGCNGTAEVKFTAPVYMWLLEHM